MKKIIALIMATLMVMCAVAACGNTETSSTTAGTTTTQATTTTATTEAPKPVEPYTAVCFYTNAESPKGVDITNGNVIGKLTPANGVELKAGYLYVVDVVPAENKATATKEIGAAVADKKVALGWTNVKSNGGVLGYTSYFHREKTVSGKTSDGTALGTLNYNFCYGDLAALNTALEGTNLGKFGTISIKMVDGDISTFVFDGGESEEMLTDYKWNFAYVGYNGETYGMATGNTWTPVAMNAKDIIYSACDKAFGDELGTLRGLNVIAMDNYKAPESVVAANGKYNGTTIQETHVANFKNGFVPIKYAAALKNYKALVEAGKADADIAKALTDADAALAAAQKAFDDAVAANADVKALKDAMTAANEALEAAKQAAYEAKAAHETAKAKDSKSQETADLLAVRNTKEAAQKTAQTTYDNAKKAFDDAVAANASLKALNDTLKAATDTQKTAKSDQTKVDEFKKWSELYKKFAAAYAEYANVALWDVENMDDCAINKYYKDIVAEERVYPTFTYYYDAATETYTIFVSSATADNMVEFFSNNDPIK